LYPEGANIKVEQIRDLKKDTRFGPLHGKYKCVVLHDVEKMTIEAANSFLKLLEEPPKGLVFILLTANISSILPTIKSRSQMLYFSQLTSENVKEILIKQDGMSDLDAQNIVNVVDGEYSIAKHLVEDIDKYKEWIFFLHKKTIVEILKFVEKLVANEKDHLKEIINVMVLMLKNKITQENITFEQKTIYRECVQICLNTIENMKNNINLRLHLENMFLKLRKGVCNE
jgi:DNA polymerase III subunit delta'